MNEPAASECPILPSRFLEANHHVFGVQSSLCQRSHQLFEQLPFHLDATADRPQDLDKGELFAPFALDVWIACVEAKILRLKLNDST